jgi:ABC-type branched-subunit amino acid transport system substrate-binding protein
VSEALKKVSFDGSSGQIQFDQFGDRKSANISVMQYKDGKFVVLEK